MAGKRRIDRLWSAPALVAAVGCAVSLAVSLAASAGAKPALQTAPFGEQKQLTVTDAANLGDAVALSANGSTAIAGASSDDGGAGAAFVFTRTKGVWSQPQKLTGDSQSSLFGASVALSADGNTALVGDPHNSAGTGAAWVFTRSRPGSPYTFQQKLTPADTAGDAGQSVSLSSDGNTALVGAPDDSSDTGAAWAYSRAVSSWSPPAQLLATSETGPGRFGASVAVSGDGATALVGAPQDRGGAGAAWFFAASGSSFVANGGKVMASAPSGATSQFGASTALGGSGTEALIGGPFDDGGAGAAWALTRSASGWSQQKLRGVSETGDAEFGASVALSSDGRAAVVGGPDDSSRAGAVWPFTGSALGYSPSAEKFPGDMTDGAFGGAVTLSGDGNTALIGSPGASSAIEGTATVLVWPPAVTALRPAGGSVAGGTRVTITGANLNGTTAVSFGARAASSFAVVSPGEITAISPPGRAGSVAVAVTTAAGASSNATFTFKGPPLPRPTITHAHVSRLTVSFTLNEAARLTVRLTAREPGRRHRKRCVPVTEQNRMGRKCTRTRSAGTLTRAEPPGTHRIALGKYVKSPGHYTVAIAATNADGEMSKPARLSFRIVS